MNQQCPVGLLSYVIQRGDTFYKLAQQYDISVEAILQYNPGVDPNHLQVGQVICLPGVVQVIPIPCGYGLPYVEPGYFVAPGVGEAAFDEALPAPGNEQQAPTGPPPNFTPAEPALRAVDPGAIRFCRFRFTYLWLRNRDSFWAFLTFVGRNSVAGWRFQRGRWSYFGVDLREIRSFTCS